MIAHVDNAVAGLRRAMQCIGIYKQIDQMHLEAKNYAMRA